MKRKGLVALILILLLLLAICGAGFVMMNYAVVNFHLYPKSARSLDLRAEDLSLSRYRSLQRSMPGCDILWNVPFQGRLINSNAREITLTELSEDDILTLACFPNLTAVHAEGCTDYENLAHLRQSLPNVELTYFITLGGLNYAQDADLVELTDFTGEDVAKLAYLSNLSTVIVSGGTPESLSQAQSYCRQAGVAFLVRLGNKLVETSATNLTVEDVTDAQLHLLGCLPDLNNGIYQLMGAATLSLRNRIRQSFLLRKLPEGISHLWQSLWVYLLFAFSLIFFRAESISSALGIIKTSEPRSDWQPLQSLRH